MIPARNGSHRRGRFRLAWLPAFALSLVCAGAASAAPLVYEGFVYDAGTVLDGVAPTGDNLTGTYDTFGTMRPLVVGAPGLDYGNLTGLPSPSGNRLTDTSGGALGHWASVSVDQDVSTAPGETIYFSALFTFDDSVDGGHLANISLGDADTGEVIFFGQGGGDNVYIGADTFSAFLTDGIVSPYADGDTLLLVGRYFNSAAAGGDTLDMIGYDTATAGALASSFDPTDPNAAFAVGLSNLTPTLDIDLAKVSAIQFAIRGADNNFIDELRIGRTYADVVVPEPGTVGLLLVGLAAVARGARGGTRRG